MTARTLMVVGSLSSAGKSLLVTALCRIFARRGLSVAPFKAQNLSNNAAVCADGGEIGRAQALQALACGLAPTVDLNPVLIKPEADGRAQFVVMGRPWFAPTGLGFDERKAILWRQVTAALDRLRAAHDLVIIEGAGSPAELNLRQGDIVNLPVARYADAPVVLVGDIERGGVFAQLLGTLWLLEPDERAFVRGLIVNKFHGDPALFIDGNRILTEKSGLPVLGVVPFLPELHLPEEDAVVVQAGPPPAPAPGWTTEIAVLALPRIANFDDFDALKSEPGVQLRYVHALSELGAPDAIVIPGTKSTIADLAWLRTTGLADAVQRFAEAGGAVAGICGGYQILGQRITDPLQRESSFDDVDALGLLPVVTEYRAEKVTHQVEAVLQGGPGWMAALAGLPVTGYEIHLGDTPTATSWLQINRRSSAAVGVADGAVAAGGRIWGSYLHGLFANDTFRHAWLESLGRVMPASATPHATALARALDRLADTVEAALDMARLENLIWGQAQ